MYSVPPGIFEKVSATVSNAIFNAILHRKRAISRFGGAISIVNKKESRIHGVLAAAGPEKGENVRPLSPPSGAPRRICAIADEERSRPQFD
jgi:hypothetical protein